MKSGYLAFLTGVVSLTCCSLSMAAETCRSIPDAIKQSNSVILLGGTAKGKIKQLVMGEFGKNVNSQKRVLGQFDRCGQLIVADISYDKNDQNSVLAMVQHISRVSHGWLAEYQISIKVQKEDALVEVNNKRGNISYMVGTKGNIISASDSFMLMGKKGFTETTYDYDKQLRLSNSTSRGSDALTNGEYRYRWNKTGLLLGSSSAQSQESYTYDNQQRELGMRMVNATSNGSVITLDECQSWDKTGNCTLSYSHETETAGQETLQRQLGTAYRFEYWDGEAE
ncbi:hypothetical protein COO59_17905 [Mixta theicola]|uniref:Uncharacterized protein n=1 Tax=Mixta theicola TaxID=1458355 RepID=A0A2K1Q5M0_9GAMM|nr:hypothetical protein [Mixta theicola]PNS10329.1 hypothetical protein COO59_17905 [Mixta theicola]GLR07310.1 hypothetical protein GCM10007905_00290 [Mixta theicola]